MRRVAGGGWLLVGCRAEGVSDALELQTTRARREASRFSPRDGGGGGQGHFQKTSSLSCQCVLCILLRKTDSRCRSKKRNDRGQSRPLAAAHLTFTPPACQRDPTQSRARASAPGLRDLRSVQASGRRGSAGMRSRVDDRGRGTAEWGGGKVEIQVQEVGSAHSRDRRITRRREIVRDRKSKWTHSVPICARLNEQDRRRPVPALKRQMQRRVACVGRDRKSGQ